MINKYQKILALFILSIILLSVAISVNAQEKTDSGFHLINCSDKPIKDANGQPMKDSNNNLIVIKNDCSLNEFGELLVKIAGYLLSIAGSLALIMFVYGGFTWLASGGNKESIQKGKNILVSAVIGLVIVFTAFLVVNLILKELTGSTEIKGVDDSSHPWYQLSR